MYCKYVPSQLCYIHYEVLIVAKCIVNTVENNLTYFESSVLIVAKCIVNEGEFYGVVVAFYGINSSKVYCKFYI